MSNNRLPTYYKQLDDYIPPHQEELKLWQAVVWRGALDYVNFIERIIHIKNDTFGIYNQRKTPTAQHWKDLYNKMNSELRELNWFLFDKIASPHNCQYIFTEFFEDAVGFLEKFRIKLQEDQQESIEDFRTLTRYSVIYDALNAVPKREGDLFARYFIEPSSCLLSTKSD